MSLIYRTKPVYTGLHTGFQTGPQAKRGAASTGYTGFRIYSPCTCAHVARTRVRAHTYFITHFFQRKSEKAVCSPRLRHPSLAIPRRDTYSLCSHARGITTTSGAGSEKNRAGQSECYAAEGGEA